MRIALLNENSTSNRNGDIYEALSGFEHEIINLGMTGPEEKPVFSYIDTGLMSGVLLNSGAVDFVVTGCGTGEGAMLSLNKYPGVFCGHILEPTDAFLFSQINAGNAISLMLNKGYGWGAELNLKYIFEKLFSAEWGSGYPKSRSAPQKEYRRQLIAVSNITQKDMLTILKDMPRQFIQPALECRQFIDCLENYAPDSKLTAYIRSLL